MKFDYVIKVGVEVFDKDFDEMIKYLRTYPSTYAEAIYDILEERYDTEIIASVENQLINELKKREYEDRKQKNIYLNSDGCSLIDEFFDLIDRISEELEGEKNRTDIIFRLLKEKDFKNDDEIRKINFK